MIQKQRHIAILLVLAIAMSPMACTTATGPPQPIPHQALISLGIMVGTGAFLREHPALAPLVYQIAHDAANATEGPLDVTQLAPTLAAAIDRVQLSAERKMLLQMLSQAILAEVQSYLTRARLAPTQVQMLVSDVFSAMERAALMRLGGVAPVAGIN